MSVRVRTRLVAVVALAALGLGFATNASDSDDDDDVILKFVVTWKRDPIGIVVTHNGRTVVSHPHRLNGPWTGALAVRPTDRVTLWVKQEHPGKMSCDMLKVGRFLQTEPVDHSEREDMGSIRCYFNRAAKNDVSR